MFPAAVAERGIGIGASWSASKGNFWRLFVYNIIWAIIILVIIAAYGSIVMSEYWEMITAVMMNITDEQALSEIELRMFEWQSTLFDMSNPGFWRFWISSYIFSIFFTAIYAGYGAIAYRYLTDGRGS